LADLQHHREDQPITITVAANTTEMTPGTYSATIRVATAAQDQSVISLRDAP